MDEREQARTAFEDAGVAAAYRHRPPYSPQLYEHLLNLAPRRERALDLGCGPGKVTRELAKSFAAVDAVEPSIEMLKVAAQSPRPNVNWLHARTEDAVLPGGYQLVTAGASIHWMQHETIFPKLEEWMTEDGVFAVFDGDGAHAPPWEKAWTDFLVRWIERLGGQWDPKLFRLRAAAHEAWMDVAGRRTFEHVFSQSIKGFIECQHSRATFSRTRMGPLADEYDSELAKLLEPHADAGSLLYKVRTELVWGRPRKTSK